MFTKVQVKVPRRGFPSYPTNGYLATKFMVVIGDDKRWRRVCDRFDEKVEGVHTFVPCVLDADGMRDLTADEVAQVGYEFKTCRTT